MELQHRVALLERLEPLERPCRNQQLQEEMVKAEYLCCLLRVLALRLLL